MFSHYPSVRARMASGVALLALALAPVQAQEAQTQEQGQAQDAQGQQPAQAQQTQEQEGQTQQGQQQTQGGEAQQAQEGQAQQNQQQAQPGTQQAEEADVLIATVGATDIRASDVLQMIEAMPPGVQQQPREMLVPLAIEQVVLRELILQQAMAENLATDPDVVAMVEGARQIAEEDAMVGVWLQRAMQERVTDERVQEVYDQLQAEADQEMPPLETVRPQIEQQLGREAIEGIRTELSEDISVVYYGPDGQPVETTAEPEPGTAPEGQEGQAGAGTPGAEGEAGTGTPGTEGQADTGTPDTEGQAGAAGTPGAEGQPDTGTQGTEGEAGTGTQGTEGQADTGTPGTEGQTDATEGAEETQD